MRRKSFAYSVLVLGIIACTAHGSDAPEPIYAKDSTVRVQWIKRIWCEGPHNAFPDVEFFNGQWYVATREGTAHGVSGFGRVRIITSKDTDNWQSAALFGDFGDHRRAELSITPDNRLMVLSKFNKYGKPADASRSFKATDLQGKEHDVATQGVENRVAFSKDGVAWTKMEAARGTHPRAWFYSGVQWFKGIGYAIDRQGRQLYRSRDGLNFEQVSQVPVSNESRISFLPDGTMMVFFRNGSLASSPPPYQEWTLNEKNKKGNHSYGGPGILALPNGEVWTASRHRSEANEFAFPQGENAFADGTVLFRLEQDKLAPKLLIRGGGDRGYNGLVWHDGFLWMVYNAPSREAGKSCIYFAKIKLN